MLTRERQSQAGCCCWIGLDCAHLGPLPSTSPSRVWGLGFGVVRSGSGGGGERAHGPQSEAQQPIQRQPLPAVPQHGSAAGGGVPAAAAAAPGGRPPRPARPSRPGGSQPGEVGDGRQELRRHLLCSPRGGAPSRPASATVPRPSCGHEPFSWLSRLLCVCAGGPAVPCSPLKKRARDSDHWCLPRLPRP